MALALVWKPPGILSQSFLGTLKSKWGLAGPSRQGIGHTGTLDPFAEGLLCVGEGEGTKLLAPLTGLEKAYEVSMLLGQSSDSFDITGLREAPMDPATLDLRLKDFNPEAFLQAKLGLFMQVPPPQSAVHIDGKRAYEWAREGKAKTLAARAATILSVTHVSLQKSETAGQEGWLWVFKVTVTSGTYIRSLARDWGTEITGAPALLTRLVRYQIGGLEMDSSEGFRWLSLSDLKHLFEVASLRASEAVALQKHGRWNPASLPTRSGPQRPWLLLGEGGHPVAWADADTGRLGRVFLENPLNS